MNIFKKSLMTIFVVLSFAVLIGTAAADPTLTRTLDSTTVTPGDTVHVRLDLVLDADETLATIKERCDRTTPDVNWTLTNLVYSPEFTSVAVNDATGVYDFGVGLGTLSAGSYYVEYDLVVNSETPLATYDLVGSYVSYQNPNPGIAATGNTQLTATQFVDVLFDDTVILGEGATDLDALDATGLTHDGDTGFVSTIGSYVAFYDGSPANPETSQGWSIWINGALTPLGIGQNNVTGGDTLEFIYSNYSSDWSPDLTTATARVTVTVDSTPLVAVRTLPYETVYTGSTGPDRIVNVEVDITVKQDVEGLTLTEILPDGLDEGDVTLVDNDDAEFKPGAYDNTVEWLWSGEVTAGTEKHIEYTITVDQHQSEANYVFEGSFVDAYHVDDFAVTGEDTIRVTGDWNPWNDEDSSGQRLITDTELQEAVYCWVNDLPAPITGATVSTTRLQALVYFWVTDLPMGDNEE